MPGRLEEIDRTIEIGRGAFVDGVVFCRTVEIFDGPASDPDQMTRVQALYGTESVTVGDCCIVSSHTQSNGPIRIGRHYQIYGDIVGESVVVDDDTAVAGSIIAKGDIVVGCRVSIGGYVISQQGSVVVNDGSQAFDIAAHQDIHLGPGVIVTDPVIFSGVGEVSLMDQVAVGGVKVETHGWTSTVNTNSNRFESIEYETILNLLTSSFNQLN